MIFIYLKSSYFTLAIDLRFYTLQSIDQLFNSIFH